MFVRDKDKNTRGPGAIAAMDEVSPNRRIAAARQERALARRDAIMALRTLGAKRAGLGATLAQQMMKQKAVPPPTRTGSSVAKQPWYNPTPRVTKTSTVETGQESAFSRTPMAPGKFIKLGQRPKGLLVPGIVVKLPGDQLSVKTDVKTATPPVLPPVMIGPAAPKVQTVIVGGGASPMPAPKGASPVPEVPPMEPMDIPDPGGAAAPAKPAKTQGNMLLYAALGVGVLWLLTRKDD